MSEPKTRPKVAKPSVGSAVARKLTQSAQFKTRRLQLAKRIGKQLRHVTASERLAADDFAVRINAGARLERD